MDIILAFTLFSLIILIYWVIAEFFTVLFRFTGVPDEKARFQVVSLLTGCGYTTRESELLVSTRSRRRLSRMIMLFGYVFNITFITALINVFLSLKSSDRSFHQMIGVLFPVAAVAVIFLFIRIPRIHTWGEYVLEQLVGKIMKSGKENTAFLLDYINDDSIVQVNLKQVPEQFVGKALSETGIKADHKILVMLVDRGKAEPATAETVFQAGDKLTVFGDYSVICSVFEAQEQHTLD